MDANLSKKEKRRLTANIIADRHVSDLGQRMMYAVTAEEFLVFLASGAAVIICLNHDNKDGTFRHKLEFGDKIFSLSTTQMIAWVINEE